MRASPTSSVLRPIRTARGRTSANLINANTPNNDFTGTGATSRAGSLSATITARVMDVLPNGNLAIEGKREIYVNNEKKEILLQGVVRPRDIAFNNTISLHADSRCEGHLYGHRRRGGEAEAGMGRASVRFCLALLGSVESGVDHGRRKRATLSRG